MIKGYIKRIVKDEIGPRITELESEVTGTAGPRFGGLHVFFGRIGLKTRVTSLEQKVDLLLKHLNLCKTDVPAKTVLKKCKEAK